MTKKKFDPPSRSAFDPVRKSAFDPVRESKWTPRKKPPPKLEIFCNDCNWQIRSSFDNPLCKKCADKLNDEIQLLREELDNWVCPHCGYPEINEYLDEEE